MTLISTHFGWNVQNQTDFAIAMQMRIKPWSIIINNGQIKNGWKICIKCNDANETKSVTNGTTNLSTMKLKTFICILFKCSSVAFNYDLPLKFEVLQEVCQKWLHRDPCLSHWRVHQPLQSNPWPQIPPEMMQVNLLLILSYLTIEF